MTNITTSRPVPFGAVAILNVVNFFNNTAAALVGSYRAAKTRKILTNLSNAQLDDIGIMPGDIAKISHRVNLLH